MAKKSMILKQQAPAKYSTRQYNRCKICGRPHAYLRNYGICRIASVSWRIRARSPASAKPAGKILPFGIVSCACCIPDTAAHSALRQPTEFRPGRDNGCAVHTA